MSIIKLFLIIQIIFVFSGSVRTELVFSRGTCVSVVGGGGEGGDSPLHLLYEPRFLAGSRPSKRIGKWCIYGVSFIVASCTLIFRDITSWGRCSFNVR